MRGQAKVEPHVFAHSREGVPPERWQPLADHLAEVARLAGEFASSFGSAAWARAAGILHDLGKAHPAFQAYLRKENGLDPSDRDDGGAWEGHRINHSGVGAIQAVLGWSRPAAGRQEATGAMKGAPAVGSPADVMGGRILAYLVAGHHAGLPDWHGGRDSLATRLKAEREVFEEASGRLEPFLGDLPQNLQPPSFARACRQGEAIAFHFWVRMLFSCLVDADFLDTEAFMDQDRRNLRPTFPSLAELKGRFDAGMETFRARGRGESAHDRVNRLRASILAACRQAASRPPGFFGLTVPTGGGKTLSGTAFALDHAVQHGLRRIVYVIPYTSIIEQTAEVLRRFLGAENVVEHHSNVAPEKEHERPGLALAAENWDAPVVVTTNVQFFESLYAASPSRCRKLHNLARSVIILDEAQLLPAPWLVPCVEALQRLVSDYGATVVFSTATQPALPGLVGMVTPIVEDEARLYQALRRTEVRFPPQMVPMEGWDGLAAELAGHRQVLCIVNRRRDCYELFRAMPEGTLHLSALMCGAHRSAVIAAIKERLAAGEPVRVVSTQLVEAGVDLDFPVVYRALAGLDSINQAAGRCNREGRLPGLGVVHVFVPPEPSPPGLLRKGEDTTRSLMSEPGFVPDDPAVFPRFFAQLYDRANDLGGDWWRERLVKNVNDRDQPGAVQFRTAGREFRLIEESTVPIVVEFGDSQKYIRQLREGGPSRECLRAVQRYVVNVHRQTAKTLLEKGFITEVKDGILIQVDSSLYHQVIGLDVWREAYQPEDLVL